MELLSWNNEKYICYKYITKIMANNSVAVEQINPVDVPVAEEEQQNVAERKQVVYKNESILDISKFFLASLWQVYIRLVSTHMMSGGNDLGILEKVKNTIITLQTIENNKQINLMLPTMVKEHPLTKPEYFENINNIKSIEGDIEPRDVDFRDRLQILENKSEGNETPEKRKNILIGLITMRKQSTQGVSRNVLSTTINQFIKLPPKTTEENTVKAEGNAVEADGNAGNNTTKEAEYTKVSNRIMENINRSVQHTIETDKYKNNKRIQTMIEQLKNKDYNTILLYLDSLIALYTQTPIEQEFFNKYINHLIMEDCIYQFIKYLKTHGEVTNPLSELRLIQELIQSINVDRATDRDDNRKNEVKRLITAYANSKEDNPAQKQVLEYCNILNSILFGVHASEVGHASVGNNDEGNNDEDNETDL